MSLLKQHKTKILADTWRQTICSDWKDNQMALNIISQGQFKLFQDSLNENNCWNWFRLILLTPVEYQLKWLEHIILKGQAIDKPWYAMDTGHQITIFDLEDEVEDGLIEPTIKLIQKMKKIYYILFMKQSVQPAIDLLTDLVEDQEWLELNILLSSYILGPLNCKKPILHYAVTMQRYDLVRALLDNATTMGNNYDHNREFRDAWINMTDDTGKTVLHLACTQHRDSWMKWFVSHKANPYLMDNDGKSCFHYIYKRTELEILYSYEDVSHEWDKIKKEILLNICRHKNIEALEWILSNGKLGIIDSEAINICLNNEDDKSVGLLIEHGVDPNFNITSTCLCKNYILLGGKPSNPYKIIELLHSEYSEYYICMLMALYSNNKDAFLKYSNLLSDEEFENFSNKLLGIHVKCEETRKIQNNIQNVIHMRKENYK